MHNQWPHVASVKRANAAQENEEWSRMSGRAVIRPRSELQVMHLHAYRATNNEDSSISIERQSIKNSSSSIKRIPDVSRRLGMIDRVAQCEEYEWCSRRILVSRLDLLRTDRHTGRSLKHRRNFSVVLLIRNIFEFSGLYLDSQYSVNLARACALFWPCKRVSNCVPLFGQY